MLQMFYVTLWAKLRKRRMKKFSITCMLSRTVPFCWGSCRHFCSINMTASILLTSRWMWALIVRWTCTAPIPATNCWWRWTFEACYRPRGREMAAGKAAGRVLCDPEQSGQGLLPHHHVQGLFHQREPVPLAEPEHHRQNSATGQRYIHHP